MSKQLHIPGFLPIFHIFIKLIHISRRTLRELNLEGNQLPAMPSGALRLDLDVLNVKNNFMHPLFWQESTKNEPQVSLLTIQKHAHALESCIQGSPNSYQTLGLCCLTDKFCLRHNSTCITTMFFFFHVKFFGYHMSLCMRKPTIWSSDQV